MSGSLHTHGANAGETPDASSEQLSAALPISNGAAHGQPERTGMGVGMGMEGGAIPITFGPTETRSFGWFHAAQAPQRAVGVVLCRPVGYEGNCAYETFTQMAEHLSRAGFAVIRFDSHGTGDSGGSDADPDRVAAWLSSVTSAVAEIQKLAGVRKVSLFGVRLGATLAAKVAADRAGVESLVLWAPCVSGRTFARELRASSSTNSDDSKPTSADIEALGYLYTEQTLKDLATLDLLKLEVAPAKHVLIIARDDMPNEGPLPASLRKLGAEVTFRNLPGYRRMMVEPHEGDVAHDTLKEITTWLSELHPVASAEELSELTPARPEQREAIFGHVREIPLIFGPERNLFGILAEPAHLNPADPRSRRAILMLNVGTNHRVGPNRLYVKMARAWAARGYRSLRFDLAGIGDSRSAEGYSSTRLYSKGSTADVQTAMDALAEHGCDEFVVMGLCSGAYVAFQTALADRRVAGQILMNPRRLNWKEGDTLESVMTQSYKSTNFYRRALFEPDTYARLLRGKIDVRGIGGRMRALLQARLERAARRLLGQDPAEEEVLANLRLLCDRGTDALFLVGAEDDGLDYLQFHLGTRGNRMKGHPRFQMSFIEGSDHTFSRADSQHHVINLVLKHLDRHVSVPSR